MGYIDHSGSWAIAPQFELAWRFPPGESRARIRQCRKIGYVDPYGRVAIGPADELTYVDGAGSVSGSDFSEGLVTFANKAFDLNGHVAFSVDSSKRLGRFVRGLAPSWPEARNTVSFVDRGGRVVISDEQARCPSETCAFGEEGLVPLQRSSDGKWGFLDRRGTWAIPPQFDQASPFDQGLAVVRKNGKSGLIEPSGAFAVSARFDGVARRFSERLAQVRVSDLVGFIDRRGEMIIPPRFTAEADAELSSLTARQAAPSASLCNGGRHHLREFCSKYRCVEQWSAVKDGRGWCSAHHPPNEVYVAQCARQNVGFVSTSWLEAGWTAYFDLKTGAMIGAEADLAGRQSCFGRIPALAENECDGHGTSCGED